MYLKNMGFKENLKSELAYSDMMVKELAARSGLNKRAIDNYLNNHNAMPSAEAAVKIAEALEVSVEYLVTGRERRRDKAFACLAPDLRQLLQIMEALDEKDRRIVLNLAKSLTERGNPLKSE